MTAARRLTALMCGVLLAAALRAENAPPHAWLERMNQAVRELDYEGRFVVQAGDRLDAMYLVHRVDGGVEKERMVALTGTPREIIRSGEAVACLVPDRNSHINVGRRPIDRSFSPLNGIGAEQLAKSYRMRLLDHEDIAGRKAQQILIEPLDALRYGYRLSLDTQTALPLRSVMFDEDGRAVTQMMFVELKVHEGITPIEHDISAMRLARAEIQPARSAALSGSPAWRVDPLPSGFKFSTHRRRPASDGDMEHLIYSDGLATVSLYIQQAKDQGIDGVSRFGGAKAIGRVIGDREVIVVGEVPVKTLRWFLKHIEPAQP